jgi:hypothetical protein
MSFGPYGGHGDDTAVFDTAIVTETRQSDYQDITDVGGMFLLYESPSLPIYSGKQEFHVAFALWRGVPGDTELFATTIVPQIHKSGNAEIAYVGEVLHLSGCTTLAYVHFVPR